MTNQVGNGGMLSQSAGCPLSARNSGPHWPSSRYWAWPKVTNCTSSSIAIDMDIPMCLVDHLLTTLRSATIFWRPSCFDLLFILSLLKSFWHLSHIVDVNFNTQIGPIYIWFLLLLKRKYVRYSTALLYWQSPQNSHLCICTNLSMPLTRLCSISLWLAETSYTCHQFL